MIIRKCDLCEKEEKNRTERNNSILEYDRAIVFLLTGNEDGIPDCHSSEITDSDLIRRLTSFLGGVKFRRAGLGICTDCLQKMRKTIFSYYEEQAKNLFPDIFKKLDDIK